MTREDLLQSSLEDLKRITKTDFAILEGTGSSMVSTFETWDVKQEQIQEFATSGADSQTIGKYLFLRIQQREVYLLIVRSRGEDVYVIGQIAASEIRHILQAFQQELDERSFYKKLLEADGKSEEIKAQAQELGIAVNGCRGVYLLELEESLLENAKMVLAPLFTEEENHIEVLDRKHLLVILTLKNKKEEQKLQSFGEQMLSLLTSELLSKVRISYGGLAHNLMGITEAYREARVAMEVAQIFYQDQMVAGYSSLGIGLLIHELPLSLCEKFLKEVFGNHKITLSEEELNTIERFFQKNLNISETARDLFIHRNTLVYHLEKLQKTTGLDIRKFDDALTFKIASMVVRYVAYLKQ